MQMQNAEDTGAIASRFNGTKSYGNPSLMDKNWILNIKVSSCLFFLFAILALTIFSVIAGSTEF